MHRYHAMLRIVPALLAGLLVCGGAWAGEVEPSAIEGFGSAVDAGVLEGLRGGEIDNDLRNNGIVSDNQAENVSSGGNVLTGHAFANANGISTVIQNSGSNVLIQNAMIVNVKFAGAGP